MAKVRASVAAAALAAATFLGWPAEAQAAPPTEDFYVDARGRSVPFHPMYEGWFGPDRYEVRFWRATAEHAILLTLELGIYWADWDSSVVDWQFPDIGTKFSSREAFRLDDNLLQTNYIYHSFAGGSHYVVSRTNGFGVAGAWASAAASSAFYELVLEWKEIVSFNDLIVTPFGGTAMGEFFNQLGNYLNSQPAWVEHHGLEDMAHESSRALVGGPRGLHDAMDDRPKPPRAPPDNLGLSSAYHHRFRVLLGRDMIADDSGKTGGVFSADGRFEIAAMPGFQRPGRFSLWYRNGNFTSLSTRLGYGLGAPGYGRNARNVELFFDAHLFGYYGQDLEASPDGLRGHAYEFAVASGMRYADRFLLGRLDQFGIVHLPHPMERVWFALGPIKVELEVDISPDFGSLHSAAYETYAERFGTEGTKSSLLRHGYFHGWGLSAGSALTFSTRDVRFGAHGRYGRYESIDGVERVQEEVTREPHGSETMSEVAAYFALEPRRTALAAQIEAAQSTRDSALGNIETLRTTRRVSVGLGVHF